MTPAPAPRILSLGSPFTHHAVLQRGQKNRIWGWEVPSRPVAITLYGATVQDNAPNILTVEADESGQWAADLPPLEVGPPFQIVVQGSREVTLLDVVAGEVWLASGQSNMHWPVESGRQAAMEIATANLPGLRMFNAANTFATEPQSLVDGQWEVAKPETVGKFSAVAYAFARELHMRLGVPVGILHASWGGTRVEAWMSPEVLREHLDYEAEFKAYLSDEDEAARMRQEHARRAAKWELANLPEDPGNTGLAQGWAGSGFDDRAWMPVNLPRFWQSVGWQFNGVVWFRHTLTIPQEWAGRALELSLGVLDDFDSTYVNGVEVGSHPRGTPAAYTIPRVYEVPADLVMEGSLTIAVRVFDHFGQGGFAGPVEAMKLAPVDAPEEALSLATEWRMEVEHRLPPLDPAVFRTFPPQPAVNAPQNGPAALYHGMLSPLIPYGVRGFLWYQGESNAGRPDLYALRCPAMVRDWRARWGGGDLPFYYVQLAGWQGANSRAHNWANMREGQAACLELPNTGMAMALDVGEADDIHPRDKQTVGFRLALVALRRAYGIEGVVDRGPHTPEIAWQEGGVRVEFTGPSFERPDPLLIRDGDPAVRGFELAGPDGVFHPAEAHLEDAKTVVVSSSEVAEPTELRYAWSDQPSVNLIHREGLPAEPFRASRED